MKIEIFHKGLVLHIHGLSAIAENKDYGGTAFKLMNQMWVTVKSQNIKNRGQNIWVYDAGEKVFAGLELESSSGQNTGLEEKIINLAKFARNKHIGPYNLIRNVGQKMRKELEGKGFDVIFPYIEIYGHWTQDESKLETDLYMCLGHRGQAHSLHEI